MATQITVRNWHSDIITSGETQGDEVWQQALCRLYNKAIHAGRRARHIALSNHFSGGGTYHIQMGYDIGRGGSRQTTLDDTIIVQVSHD